MQEEVTVAPAGEVEVEEEDEDGEEEEQDEDEDGELRALDAANRGGEYREHLKEFVLVKVVARDLQTRAM